MSNSARPLSNDGPALAERLSAVVELDSVDELVARYLVGPAGSTFAGCLFDSLGSNKINQVSPDDLAAASLLDVRFSPRAVHRLIEERFLDEHLLRVPSSVELFSADDSTLEALQGAYAALLQLPDVGPTRASKLLARKRPALAPITDSVVERVLGTTGWTHLRALRDALTARHEIESRLADLSSGVVSPLRALDIAIWMIGSRSRSARRVREELGVPEDAVRFG